MRGSEETLGSLEGRHHVAPLRREERNKRHITEFLMKVHLLILSTAHLPAGMMTDKAVAEADLITLVPGREVLFSPSAESCWWRTLRSTRSVAVPRGPCGSGRPRIVALLGRGNIASAGLKCLSVR